MCLANSLMWPNVFLFTTYHELCAQHVLFLCGLVQVNFTNTGLPRTGHDTQSHRPDWHETDLKPTKIIKFGESSVYSRYWFAFVGLVQTNLSGRDLSNMFERSLPDKLLVVCRLYVDVVSVLSGSVRGRVGLNFATDGRWLSFLDRLCIGHFVGRPDTDSRPIQDRIKSDITSNCVESADTFPNQNRRVPDISRTQTECKRVPITVCGVIPTSKSSQNSGKYLFTKVAT